VPIAGVAPGFSLRSASGQSVSLQDLRGQYVVLCFLPRAGTSGYAQRTRGLRALLPQFSELDAHVVAISAESPPGRAGFAEEAGLIVLADPDRVVARAYGVAESTRGVEPTTFLLDRAGGVRQVWPRVKVEGHAEEVLAAVRSVHAADGAVNPLIQTRRAYRALSEEPVARAVLDRLVEAAHLAPSCSNNQPWRFVVAHGEALERVKAALPGGNYWAKRAPAIIALASHRDLDCKLSDARDYFLFGCGMATGMLMIQATQMGLVAHPIAGYDPLAVKEALAIPSEYVLITLIVIGKRGDARTLSDKHRERELGPRDRKPLSAVLAWNNFGDLEPTEGA